MSEISFKKKYGTWVLLVGAAEGLGEAYTIALAKKGLSIVMVDVHLESMKALSQKVESEFGIQTKTICLDLAQPNASIDIMSTIGSIDCRLVIYNAAFSKIQPFTSFTQEELIRFIDVNAQTPIKLVHSFTQKLKDKHLSGGVLLMSSLAGLIGMQLAAPYAATKAFTWNLAEALHHELKEFKIDVMCCIAGATATSTYLETQPNYGFFKPSVMQPDKLAEMVLNNIGKKNLYIPGLMNRINYFILLRLLPRKAASFLANATMKKMYGKKV